MVVVWCHFLYEPFFFSSPVFVALYMFSMGKADPRPYSNTLERAGMSWVVVTNTFTQLGLKQDRTDTFKYTLNNMLSEAANGIWRNIIIKENIVL